MLSHGLAVNDSKQAFTEDDVPDGFMHVPNVYIETKLHGEYHVIKYRDKGVSSNIYRVGNLAFMLEGGRTQENIEENAFASWLQCLFNLRFVTKDISKMEISPVDLTAQAIIKLLDKKELNNNVFHLFNSRLFDIIRVRSLGLHILTIERFVDEIINALDNAEDEGKDMIMRFMLRQGWLDHEKMFSGKILQDKTLSVLKELGFEWLKIDNKIFIKYLKNLKLL